MVEKIDMPISLLTPLEPQIERVFDLIAYGSTDERILLEIRDLIGVDHVIYTTALSTLDPTIKPLVRTTYSADWLKRYIAMSYENVDPVLKRGYASALPFVWSEVDVRSPNVASMMEDAIRHGVGPNGFSIPIASKTGRRGLFSITCADQAEAWHQFCESNLISLTRIAYQLHRRLSDGTFREFDLHLSGRETECLAWCAQGKEASDMALILGLSVHTVREYLKSARFKLGCSNLPQAVAKAMARGLISAN